jgi:hypothetical protein
LAGSGLDPKNKRGERPNQSDIRSRASIEKRRWTPVELKVSARDTNAPVSLLPLWEKVAAEG